MSIFMDIKMGLHDVLSFIKNSLGLKLNNIKPEDYQLIIFLQFMMIFTLSIFNVFLIIKRRKIDVKDVLNFNEIRPAKPVERELNFNENTNKNNDVKDKESLKDIDERENSFTMRLREDEERKQKHEKNVLKREAKKAKKSKANASDNDDAEEWQVIKGGKGKAKK